MMRLSGLAIAAFLLSAPAFAVDLVYRETSFDRESGLKVVKERKSVELEGHQLQAGRRLLLRGDGFFNDIDLVDISSEGAAKETLCLNQALQQSLVDRVLIESPLVKRRLLSTDNKYILASNVEVSFSGQPKLAKMSPVAPYKDGFCSALAEGQRLRSVGLIPSEEELESDVYQDAH